MRITENKVWLKYYSEEALNTKLPQCTAYRYMKQRNEDRLDKPALHYYGADITHRQLDAMIEESQWIDENDCNNVSLIIQVFHAVLNLFSPLM